MTPQHYRALVIETLESRQMLDASSLVVSEIMYNPAITNEQRADGLKDRDFEFIELKNAGDSPVSMAGISLDDAVTFTFGQIALAPGQSIVVVHNREAFEAQYGQGPRVAGQYAGTLGNGGDHIVLKSALNGTIMDFAFDDVWYSETDGGGHSLVVADANPSLGYPDQPTSWKTSIRTGGSPGYGDGVNDPRPKDLKATALTSRHLALRWNPPDNVGLLSQDYRVYRDGLLLASTRSTRYTDSTVAPGGFYSYQVAIVHSNDEEFLSAPTIAQVESVGGDLSFKQGVPRGTMQFTKLDELSGLVASRRNPDVLWTHEDGPQTSVYAINSQGKYLGEFELQGVQPQDWEDIAIGPGPVANVDYIYIGDIGGKKPKRNVIQIYRVPEPVVPEIVVGQKHIVSDYATITLQYPDANELNAEALLSDPVSGDLFVIPKQGSETPVYRAPASTLTSRSTVILELAARLKFPNVSGGDISPSGNEILIRKEDFAQLFHRGEGMSVADAFLGEPIDIPVIGRPIEPNGEAIAFDSIGHDYLTISEGVHQPLYSFQRVPTAQAGDANRDLEFDQVDIITVLRGGKFRTEEPATWSEGDWNGDGIFDNLDIVAALQTGNYLQGQYRP